MSSDISLISLAGAEKAELDPERGSGPGCSHAESRRVWQINWIKRLVFQVGHFCTCINLGFPRPCMEPSGCPITLVVFSSSSRRLLICSFDRTHFGNVRRPIQDCTVLTVRTYVPRTYVQNLRLFVRDGCLQYKPR